MTTHFTKLLRFKILIISILVTLLTPHHLILAKRPTPPSYILLGEIKDRLLVHFLKNRKKRMNAIIIDGTSTHPRFIEKNPAIQTAIYQSTPIIIANPTPQEMFAITGAKIKKSKLAIIVPRKNGEEFDINIMPCQDLCTATKDDSSEHEIRQINSVLEKNQDPSEESPNSRCHKRWTVNYISPYQWGNEDQFIDVGFQYDLYYVTTPAPRKYLTVQSVGKGVSSGKMKHNKFWRRGYFQDSISVSIENKPLANWHGGNLQVEELAPESNNQEHTYTTSTGVTFSSTLYAGVSANPIVGPTPSIQEAIGVSITRTHGKSTTFNDFTVTLESTSTSDKWTYWLSGAQGTRIRRNHPRDLISSAAGKIMEIPQLSRAILRPHMEAVYYTQASETGTIRMSAKVNQHLVDIQTIALLSIWSAVKQKEKSTALEIDIDFDQVNPCPESCKN